MFKTTRMCMCVCVCVLCAYVDDVFAMRHCRARMSGMIRIIHTMQWKCVNSENCRLTAPEYYVFVRWNIHYTTPHYTTGMFLDCARMYSLFIWWRCKMMMLCTHNSLSGDAERSDL